MQGVNFKDNNTKPRGRRSAPKAETRRTGKAEPYAYDFEYKGMKFSVLNSANGWWVKEDGKVKLHKLVTAYEFYYTDDQACGYAEISKEQLSYFQELHPDFYGIKHAAKQSPNQRAKKKLVGELDNNVELSKWWLERTEKDTFSPRVEATGANGRDLFDGLSQEIKQLGEELRNEHDDDDEKHPSAPDSGHPDAGPERTGDEATPAETTVAGSGVPA